MKKIVLSILLMVIFATKAVAYCDFTNYCAKSPYKGMSKDNISTPNTFAENFAQEFIKNIIKALLHQECFVDIKLFGFQELLQGKFRSLTVSANNVAIEGFHFTSIRIQTLCDYNYIDINTRPINIKENLVLSVAVEASAADIRKTLDYKNYSRELSTLNLSDLGISSFKAYSPSIDIKNGKLYFMINALYNGVYTPVDIPIRADLQVQNGQLVKSQLDFINYQTSYNITQLPSLLKDIDNFNFPIIKDGVKKAEIQIKNINLMGDKVYINGFVFIPKGYL